MHRQFRKKKRKRKPKDWADGSISKILPQACADNTTST